MTIHDQPESAKPKPANRFLKPIVFGAAALAFFFIYSQYGDALTLNSLAKHEQTLRVYEHDHPWTVVGGAFLLYVVVSGLSIPGAVLKR